MAHRHVAYPVLDDGRPVGLISFRSVLAVPRESWGETRVGEAMAPLEDLPALTAEMPLEEAVQRLSDSESNRALVLVDHRLAGLLSITDATRLLEARRLVGATNGNGGARQRHDSPDHPSGR